VLDTRHYFRPLTTEFVGLLRSLNAGQWDLPTAAREWRVRDVVAHLTDTALRRVSFHRDGRVPPAPAGGMSLVTFINTLNAEWIAAMRRASPRVLTDLYAFAAAELATWLEQVPLDAPPLFPVSWAGDDGNQGWLDIGRDFTEQWHHQMQVGEAVGQPLAGHPEWLHAVLVILLRGLPHAYRDVKAARGTAVRFSITGDSGGDWWLTRETERWRLMEGRSPSPAATLRLSDDTAWRLLFNNLRDDPATSTSIAWDGDSTLVRPFFDARSVIVQEVARQVSLE
jgi:uncharacterized protein (TIGR03083 family)